MTIHITREQRYPRRFSLITAAGEEILTDDYRGGWLYLVFHRHLSCLPCRSHMSQLRQRKQQLEQLGVAVLLITFEDAEYALNYQQETGLEWPVIVDSSRELYNYYGMNRNSFWDARGPSAWVSSFWELLKGNWPKPKKGDVYQQGGDVLIDPEGMVRFHHVGKGPADRPPFQRVLDVVSSSMPVGEREVVQPSMKN